MGREAGERVDDADRCTQRRRRIYFSLVTLKVIDLALAATRAAVAIHQVAVVAIFGGGDDAVAAERATVRAAVACIGVSVVAFLLAAFHSIATERADRRGAQIGFNEISRHPQSLRQACQSIGGGQ